MNVFQNTTNNYFTTYYFLYQFTGIKCSKFGELGRFCMAYHKVENDITRFTHKMFKFWGIVVVLIQSTPFLIALANYLSGNYSISSWILQRIA